MAVYSELDRDALHVRLADEAYALGRPDRGRELPEHRARSSRSSSSRGADGVHPGYGFFSENTDFARAITERGVAFIGPPPEAIEVMGDKVSSRIAAQAAGVQGVPGTTEFLTSRRRGRGLRRGVRLAGRHQGRLRRRRARHARRRQRRRGRTRPSSRPSPRRSRASAATSATSSATSPGRATSRCRSSATPTATCVWVGERDCSAQRRHQKLIEESPAPGVPRRDPPGHGRGRRQGRQGVRLLQRRHRRVPLPGRRVLLPRDEHPPPGRAPRHRAGVGHRPRRASRSGSPSGEPLSFTQDEIDLPRPRHRGPHQRRGPGRRQVPPLPRHASPSSSPPQGFGVRWDGGYEAGDEVSQYYDNLVGKLIVWGNDRDTAIARMIRALEEMRDRGHRHHDPGRPRHPRATPTSPPAEHSTKWVEDTLDLTGVARRRRRARGRRRRGRAEGPARRRRRGQRQALRREDVGARRRRWPSSPAAARRRRPPARAGPRPAAARPRPAAARSPCRCRARS